MTAENWMCVGIFLVGFYIILHRKFMTGSNMKTSDLTVCEPQIKTQMICLIFIFWLTQNRGLGPMAAILVYVIISPDLRLS